MSSSLAALLSALGHWPRRLAALACLLLALGAAVSGHRPPAHAASADPARELGPGQRAVPVRLVGVDARTYLRPGDHIDLLAAGSDEPPGSGALIAEHLRVLALVPGDTGPSTDGGAVIVAAGRTDALQIAGQAGRPLLAVRTDSP